MPEQIPIGARVHHRGSKWSLSFDEEDRRKHPSDGWGVVISAYANRDGTFEYEVKKDAPFLPGGTTKGSWASYHIDRWEPGDLS